MLPAGCRRLFSRSAAHHWAISAPPLLRAHGLRWHRRRQGQPRNQAGAAAIWSPASRESRRDCRFPKSTPGLCVRGRRSAQRTRSKGVRARRSWRDAGLLHWWNPACRNGEGPGPAASLVSLSRKKGSSGAGCRCHQRPCTNKKEERENARRGDDGRKAETHLLFESRRGFVEIDDLDDAQIIIGAHHAGDDADDGERIKARFHGREEDVEFREEPSERRDAG